MSPELSAFRIQPPELERTSHLQGTMLLEVISCKVASLAGALPPGSSAGSSGAPGCLSEALRPPGPFHCSSCACKERKNSLKISDFFWTHQRPEIIRKFVILKDR